MWSHMTVYRFILFSLEIVTTGSPHSVLSWVQLHRNRTYGGFVDAVCDKAFVIPCWISLLHSVPETRYLKVFQYASLLCLILAETASGCIRFKAYFTSGGVPAPKVVGFDFSTSAVKADHIGKAKQTFEMVGTALFVLPLTRYCGLILLLLAVPLAYESVRRKIQRRVVYVSGGNVKTFDNKTLKFWMQAKAMGTKLIVGIPGKNVKEMVLNACASSSVDLVIAEAPAKADLMFLEKQGIDFCICAPGDTTRFVTDEVVNANRCLAIGEDGIARPLKAKVEHKE
jgi:phosphatidylglycerophosphate synthase